MPHLVKAQQSLAANMASRSADIGQHSSNMGPNLAQHGPTWTQLGPAWVQILDFSWILMVMLAASLENFGWILGASLENFGTILVDFGTHVAGFFPQEIGAVWACSPILGGVLVILRLYRAAAS